MTHARQLVARQLIDDAAFGPDALRAVRQAFDEVWSEIAWRFGTHLVVIEAARLKLADALLSIASEESRDVEVLKCFALQAMACHERATLPTRATSVHSLNEARRLIRDAAARDWWAELCVSH
jgi:hypothetical protein